MVDFASGLLGLENSARGSSSGGIKGAWSPVGQYGSYASSSNVLDPRTGRDSLELLRKGLYLGGLGRPAAVGVDFLAGLGDRDSPFLRGRAISLEGLGIMDFVRGRGVGVSSRLWVGDSFEPASVAGTCSGSPELLISAEDIVALTAAMDFGLIPSGT